MINLLEGTVRHYAWGSPTFIPDMLSLEPDGQPWAELWFGAHPTAPAKVTYLKAPASENGLYSLDKLIASDPIGILGPTVTSQFGRLPFLVKVLAASKPLSLQAHPCTEIAKTGFDREQALRIPLNASHRSFRDPHHKPELVCALNQFEVLCGLRDAEKTLMLLETIDTKALDPVRERLRTDSSPEGLRNLIGWLLSLEKHRAAKLVDLVVKACTSQQQTPSQNWQATPTQSCQQQTPSQSWDMVSTLGKHYPSDAGVIVALLLNHVTLKSGEALFLPAGNLHCYLRGTAVEVMACSDNVLRGGLTSKHIDADALLEVLDLTPSAVKIQQPELIDGVATYHTPVPEFSLLRVELESSQPVTLDGGPAILMCTEGNVHVKSTTRMNGVTLKKGQAAWADAYESAITVKGDAQVFCVHANPSTKKH